MTYRSLALALVAVVLSGVAAADTYVREYTRNDGTTVSGHYRSSPDNTTSNNWSVQGNTNPHTGERGTHRDTGQQSPGFTNYGYQPGGATQRLGIDSNRSR